MEACSCGERGALTDVSVETSRSVAGYTFLASLRGHECSSCRQVTVRADERERFELLAAGKLAVAGETSGEAFRFMRSAIRMPAERLAELLDVSAESIHRWERNDYVYRSAVEILGALVLARAGDGRSEPISVDLLGSLRFPRPMAKAVRLEMDPTQAAG